jgi:uncharacterized protein
MDHPQPFILFIASFIANWFSGLSGGGAGLIQLPLLIFLGLPFGIALATHKVASVALGLGSTIRHVKEGGLAPREALIILGAGLPGVVLGASLILAAPEQETLIVLGLLTLGLGFYSVFRPELGINHEPRNWRGIGLYTGMAGLFGVGFLNGSITSGTGLFLTMWLICHFGMDYRRAVAYTMVLCGLFWNGTGALVWGTWAPSLGTGCRHCSLAPFLVAMLGVTRQLRKGTCGSSVRSNS